MDYCAYFQGMHGAFLRGKVVVITDGAQELGLAAARAMLGLGARVMLAREEAAGPLDLNEEGLALYPAPLDCERAAEGLIRAAVDRFGGLDILVNNCDRFFGEFITDSRDADWDGAMTANLKRAYWCCKYAAKELIPRGYGKIINVTSVFGKSGQVSVGVEYAAAKSALLGFGKMLAKQLGPCHITVNSVAVGLLDSQKELVSANRDLLPLGRGALPMEVAGPIVYLASPYSDYITGYCMDVNGGMYLD